jgi:hypothetical protein
MLDARRNVICTSAHIGKSLVPAARPNVEPSPLFLASGRMVAHDLLSAVLGAAVFFAAAVRSDYVSREFGRHRGLVGSGWALRRERTRRLAWRQGMLRNAFAAKELGVCGSAPITAPCRYIVAGDLVACPFNAEPATCMQGSSVSRLCGMNPLNRVAGYVVIASVLALSACVIGPDRGYGRDDPHRQA